MDPEEVFALLRVIARLEQERDSWKQQCLMLKEQLRGFRSGEMVHPNQREADQPGSSPSDGGS